MNLSKIPKKVIVVTGSNKGIGYGILETFCQKIQPHDNKIFILTARKRELGHEALEKLKHTYPLAKENLFFYDLDVTHGDSIKKFSHKIKEDFGYINTLYNNAAIIARGIPSDKHERDKELMEIFNTNVWGLINMTEENLSLNLIKEGGHIINMSSSLGQMRFAKHLIDIFTDEHLTLEKLHSLFKEYRHAYLNDNLEKSGWDDKLHHYGPYGISKVFVGAYTRILDQRLKRKNINIKVNAVSPGHCKTDMGGETALRSYLKGAETPVWMESFTEEKDDSLSGNFYYEKNLYSWI